MNTHPILKRAVMLGSVGAAILATTAQAQFNPARGNMLWAMRDVNGGARGAFDIVVDLGSYTRFTSGGGPLLLGGSSFSEAYQGVGPVIVSEERFAHSDVLATFGNMDDILASGFGINSGASATANSSWFLTKARTDVTVQSTPWNRASAFSQGGTGNKMETIRNNAITSGADFNNTSTKEDTGVAGAYGNPLNSPFQGYIAMEASTGIGFGSTGPGMVRLDLYDVPFGVGATVGTPGSYLGFFEYQSDGDLWFVPVPEPSTYGLVAAAGLLLMALRRQFSGKTA